MVCARVGTGRPVPGARISACQKCLESVWLSPSSQSRIDKGYVIWCRECTDLEAPNAVIENPPIETGVLTELIAVWPYLNTPD